MNPKKALLMMARVVLVACTLARQEFGTAGHGVTGDGWNMVAGLQAPQRRLD